MSDTSQPPAETDAKIPVTNPRLYTHHASAAAQAQHILDETPADSHIVRIGFEAQVEQHRAALARMALPQRWPHALTFNFNTPPDHPDPTVGSSLHLVRITADAVQAAYAAEYPDTDIHVSEMRSWSNANSIYADYYLILAENTPFELLTDDHAPMQRAYDVITAAISDAGVYQQAPAAVQEFVNLLKANQMKLRITFGAGIRSISSYKSPGPVQED